MKEAQLEAEREDPGEDGGPSPLVDSDDEDSGRRRRGTERDRTGGRDETERDGDRKRGGWNRRTKAQCAESAVPTYPLGLHRAMRIPAAKEKIEDETRANEKKEEDETKTEDETKWTKVETKKKRQWKKLDTRPSLETLQKGIPGINRGFTQSETDELYDDVRRHVKYEKECHKEVRVRTESSSVCCAWRSNKLDSLGTIYPEGVNSMSVGGWEEITMYVDSGATETVMPDGMLMSVNMREGVKSRQGIMYEVANGVRIANLGEK